MKTKKIILFLLTFILVFSSCVTSFAEISPPGKEEIVYTMLANNGDINSVYVVNSYANLSNSFIDYGDYSLVRNLSTHDALVNENGKITSSVSSGKFYYEGKMNSYEMPWNFSITYKLDGQLILPKDIVGKNGNVEIKIDIKKNPKAQSIFYDNYVVSVSTMLDTNFCSNIVAKDAVVANAGESKNLTYTLLPKKDASYVITTTATNFEMGAISFNAVPFSMNVDIGEIDNVSESFKPLTDGVAKLDSGAVTLSKGATELLSGINALNNNKTLINNGSTGILKAIEEIAKGLSSFDNADDIKKLSTACIQYEDGLKMAIDALSQIGTDDENMKNLLSTLSQNPDPYVNALVTIYNGKMKALNETVDGGMKPLSDNFALIQSGVKSISGSIESLSLLANALNTLLTEYKKFDTGLLEFTDGYGKIASGYKELNNGIQEFKSGISTLNKSTSNLGNIVNEKINDALSELGGSNFEIKSFTNEKNTNITSVQFVIKADAIKVPTKAQAPDIKPIKLSFWQKLLNLFKF